MFKSFEPWLSACQRTVITTIILRDSYRRYHSISYRAKHGKKSVFPEEWSCSMGGFRNWQSGLNTWQVAGKVPHLHIIFLNQPEINTGQEQLKDIVQICRITLSHMSSVQHWRGWQMINPDIWWLEQTLEHPREMGFSRHVIAFPISFPY